MDVFQEAQRPLVGGADVNGVIDPDILWSCVTCGACVEQCPVDIEHVDHIVDMRRYQVLIEAEFPREAGTMLRNLEKNGDPWGRGAKARLEWTQGLPFEVRVLGANGEDRLPEDVEYLFWVGCAGSLDDNAKKTSRNVAELLHEAGVEFMILGSGETCTGDAARRLGQEFLFHELASQNVETLNSAGAKKIVVTCAHCFNTLANEYPQLGGHYEVVHHTELLAKLIKDGRIKPAGEVDVAVTYHDPCYLGRHNRVFDAPRDILGAIPGVKLNEMPRNREKSFCCGAGGARMWMEETIGSRINETRTDEALGTSPDLVTAACPYCIVMLTDGVNTRKQQGKADDAVRVADVSEVLLRSVRPQQGKAAAAAKQAGPEQAGREQAGRSRRRRRALPPNRLRSRDLPQHLDQGVRPLGDRHQIDEVGAHAERGPAAVGRVVADHDGRRRVHAERVAGQLEDRGVGLHQPDLVAQDHHVQQLQQARVLQVRPDVEGDVADQRGRQPPVLGLAHGLQRVRVRLPGLGGVAAVVQRLDQVLPRPAGLPDQPGVAGAVVRLVQVARLVEVGEVLRDVCRVGAVPGAGLDQSRGPVLDLAVVQGEPGAVGDGADPALRRFEVHQGAGEIEEHRTGLVHDPDSRGLLTAATRPSTP